MLVFYNHLIILQLLDFLDKLNLEIKGIKEKHIKDFLQDLKRENISKRSINRKLSSIKGYFKFLLFFSAPVVVVCRCSPTQKAKVVELVQRHTGKRTAACGDGGNDVAVCLSTYNGISY